MKKIELTPNTLGAVMDLLQKAVAGQFTLGRNYDQKPLHIKNFKHKRMHAMAQVSLHWQYVKKTEKLAKHQMPLIHVIVNATCAMYYSWGDVFYFKGKNIIIDRKGSFDVNSLIANHHRNVECITVVKYAKNLSIQDKAITEKVRVNAQLEKEAYDRQYWKDHEREMEKEMFQSLGLNEDEFDLEVNGDFY